MQGQKQENKTVTTTRKKEREFASGKERIMVGSLREKKRKAVERQTTHASCAGHDTVIESLLPLQLCSYIRMNKSL